MQLFHPVLDVGPRAVDLVHLPRGAFRFVTTKRGLFFGSRSGCRTTSAFRITRRCGTLPCRVPALAVQVRGLPTGLRHHPGGPINRRRRSTTLFCWPLRRRTRGPRAPGRRRSRRWQSPRPGAPAGGPGGTLPSRDTLATGCRGPPAWPDVAGAQHVGEQILVGSALKVSVATRGR